MNFVSADLVSISLFGVFSFLMFILSVKALQKAGNGKKWTILFITLVAAFSGAALSGLVAKTFVPFGPMLFLAIFVYALTFSLSAPGKQLAGATSLTILVGFQGFRFPLELILHHWSSIGTIPETMTWSGQNWDIAAGVVSLAAIPWVSKSKKLALAVNTLGFLLLLNVVRVVILSSPLPFSWGLENPLLLVAYFPYCLIGPLFVMPALIGHLITFRRLM